MAGIWGGRSCARVSFTKVYRQPSFEYKWPILYSGTLSDQGKVIQGRWQVESVTGTFMMHRELGEQTDESARVGTSINLKQGRLVPAVGLSR